MSGKAVAVAVAAFVALVVGGTALGFALNWGQAAVQVVSPDNVRAQWQFAYTYDESLGALAGNWCTAKQSETAEKDPDYRSQLGVQRRAYENQYRSVEAQYNAALRNAFKAKLVKPSDVPSTAPTLDQKVQALGLTCGG
jgi:hypothetical protein